MRILSLCQVALNRLQEQTDNPSKEFEEILPDCLGSSYSLEDTIDTSKSTLAISCLTSLIKLFANCTSFTKATVLTAYAVTLLLHHLLLYLVHYREEATLSHETCHTR